MAFKACLGSFFVGSGSRFGWSGVRSLRYSSCRDGYSSKRFGGSLLQVALSLSVLPVCGWKANKASSQRYSTPMISESPTLLPFGSRLLYM